MAKIMLKVTIASEAILNTINAKDQIYGKVSKSFTVRWKDVLDRFLHLLDKDGNLHTILYNQDLDRSVIVAGWISLRDFYHMTEDHQVSLTHYGKSVFFLTVFKSSSHPKSFPRRHSLYHQVPNFVTFNVLLTQHKITCSSLNISSTMYYFLKNKGWTHLNLEDIAECWIVFNYQRKTTKIGVG
ncbi:hypothetical protein HKD37_05G012919 [Glycine soja]